jgi:hypothetical protein
MTDEAPNMDTNPMDMLEVTGSSLADASNQARAARDMQAHYALLAILQGADPKEVAVKCGFTRVHDDNIDPMVDSIAPFMAQMLGIEKEQLTVGGQALNAFAEWLTAYLVNHIITGD